MTERPTWLQPLWLRVVIVAALAAWGLFELSSGNTVWAILFGIVALWTSWTLLVAWPRNENS